MTKKRIGLVVQLLFATLALVCAPFFIWSAFTPVIHVVGTVTKVVDDECLVRYTDRSGAVRTYRNFGGKYGCEDDVGDSTDLYYLPDDPTSVDTMSPLENGLSGLMMLGIAGFSGGSAVLEIREGAWTDRRLGRRPRHRMVGGRHVRE